MAVAWRQLTCSTPDKTHSQLVLLAGSGLSSSAAIVCSSALAILGVYGITLTKGEVSDFTCKSERYVGVTSGGMDQAISVMGRHGVAKMVEFNPVSDHAGQYMSGLCSAV